MWSGEKVSFHGNHFVAQDVVLDALPIQRPRVPIWIGGTEGRMVSRNHPVLRRAARWDGWITATSETPEQIAAKVEAIHSHRDSARPFDVVMGGKAKPDASTVEEYEDAGVTWWWVVVDPSPHGKQHTRSLVAAGPRL